MHIENAKIKCARELRKIAKLLEPEDRKKAMAAFDVSYVTISRYLSGKVANLILGINLLNFFKKQVRKRSDRISGLLR
jgi:predicted type IV restriction endonuclease